MTLQNQIIADENGNIFQQICFLRSNYNPKAISTCHSSSDALSHIELRVVSSAHLITYHLTIYIIRDKRRKNWRRKKNDGLTNNSDVLELMAHLEDELHFETTYPLLLLNNDSIIKSILP